MEVTIEGRRLVMTDKGPVMMDWISYDGQYWLVPVWIAQLGAKTQRPIRIIAPRAAPGYKLPDDPQVLAIFEGMPLPTSLLEQGAIPSGIARAIEVRENPDIFAQIPAGN